MNGWHESEIRVRYAETDKMGIVHHSNYLVWFESEEANFVGREIFLQRNGRNAGALLVVAECYCRYKSPAHYDDVLLIRTQIAELRSRSVRFIYEVFRPSDDTLLAEGETLHLVTDTDKKVRTLPEIYREKLISVESDDDEDAFPEDQAPS